MSAKREVVPMSAKREVIQSRRRALAASGAALACIVALASSDPADPHAAGAPGASARGTAQAANAAREMPPTARLDSQGFRLAVPPYKFEFPFDHAAHPAFRTEWWYYTGHLSAGDRRFGYELTFFRIGLPVRSPSAGGSGRPAAASGSAWRARQVLFRHLALTDETGKRFRFDDRAERQALDLAGADSTRYLVWLGDDYAGLEPDRTTHQLVGTSPEFTIDLRLTPERPAVIHGRDGVSQKSAGEGNASHYYSLTRLSTRGRLVLGRDTLAVEGLSWMDHEFGSDQLRDTHTGWDWVSVQLSDGRDLMLYRLRTVDGRLDSCSSGTIVEPDGRTRTLAFDEFDTHPRGQWVSPRTGGRYPSGWDVRVPGEALELRLSPTLDDQELLAQSMGGIAYWEGSVRVSGTSAGQPVRGGGYVELTGYAGMSPFQTSRLDSLRRVR
jgi:predicted secreted hydrolase